MTKKQEKMSNESFETQLEQLENIVQGLEGGELTLEDSLTQFEKGVKLTKKCQNILDKAEQKVSILTASGLKETELKDSDHDVT